MPKLQIFLDKGKVTFNYNNKRKRFRLLNFLRAAILDFMTSRPCLYCWKAQVLLFETIGQRSDVMKSKMAARRKFKRRNLCSFSHTCFAYRVFSDSNCCFLFFAFLSRKDYRLFSLYIFLSLLKMFMLSSLLVQKVSLAYLPPLQVYP